MDTIFKQLHQLRIEADKLQQMALSQLKFLSAPALQHSNDGIDWPKKAYECTVFLKAQLGKLKGYLGDPTPYPAAKTADAIPPTDAVWTGDLYPSNDELTNLNVIRENLARMKKYIGDFMDWDEVHDAANHLSNTDFYFFQCSKMRVIQLADEASICYGMRIRQIRETAEQKV